MRVLSIFIVCALIALPSGLNSATITQPVNKTINPPEDAFKKLASLKIKNVQKLTGRKLTLKEKVSLLILKHSSRKKAESKQGSTAFVFGIAALALFFIGLFVPYVILGAILFSILAIVLGSVAKNQDSSDKKARAAVLLGWITLGATALLLVIAAIVVASSGWI